jgi:transposase-like protein
MEDEMTKEAGQRRFSRDFKLAVLSRMAAGENVSALSRELGIARKCLYQWRDRFRLGGAVALRSRGRLTKAETLAMGAGADGAAFEAQAKPMPPPDELARARRQIAELERKIGQQALDLDFFQQALQRIEASRRPSDGPGGTASSPRSRR